MLEFNMQSNILAMCFKYNKYFGKQALFCYYQKNRGAKMSDNSNVEMDLNEILQVRRDKLKELKEAGLNPFLNVKCNVTSNAKAIKRLF
jgi:hypothetical protein